MAFWNRKNKVPNEARDYVRATDVVSRPMAILLSFLTIVIIAALVFTLFWGVKWAYDRIRGNDTITVTTSTTSSDNGSTNQNETKVTVDNPQEFPGFLSDDEINQASGQGNSSNTTSQNNSSSTTTTTQPNRIPNTGPDPDPEE